VAIGQRGSATGAFLAWWLLRFSQALTPISLPPAYTSTIARLGDAVHHPIGMNRTSAPLI
jgi:hypothetical protein